MTQANLQTVIKGEPNSCLGAQILLGASEAMVCKKSPTGEACGHQKFGVFKLEKKSSNLDWVSPHLFLIYKNVNVLQITYFIIKIKLQLQ